MRDGFLKTIFNQEPNFLTQRVGCVDKKSSDSPSSQL